MACVRRRTLKDGKTAVYLAVWKEHPAAPERTKAFARKADAERHLVDVQHRLLTGTCAPSPAGTYAVQRLRRPLPRPRDVATAHEAVG